MSNLHYIGTTACKNLANMKKQQKHTDWDPTDPPPLSSQRVNKTPLGETRCLRNLYYLLAAQASCFLIYTRFPNTVS